MFKLITLIVLVLSLGGVVFIVARKIPNLKSLPINGTAGIKKHKFILGIEAKIKGIFTYFEKQIFLHKVLSWIKVATLKVETRVDHLLHKIRKKAQQVDKKINDVNNLPK